MSGLTPSRMRRLGKRWARTSFQAVATSWLLAPAEAIGGVIAFWIALQRGDPLAIVVGVLGLIVGMLLAYLALARATVRAALRAQAEATPAAVPAVSAIPTMTGPPIIPAVTPKTPSGERHFVNAAVTPKYVCDLFVARTTVQAQTMLQAYIGQWIRVSGRVLNVENHFGNIVVFIKIGEPNEPAIRDTPAVFAEFDPEWHSRALALPPHAKITVVGSIARAQSGYIGLEHSELTGDGDD